MLDMPASTAPAASSTPGPAKTALRRTAPTHNAFVFTSVLDEPALERTLARAREVWPEMPRLARAGGKDGATILAGDRGSLVLTKLVPTPYPRTALQPLLRSVIGWPSVIADLNAHKAHAIVSVSHPDARSAHRILTCLSAAFLEQLEGPGVLWTNTLNLIPARDFLKHAATGPEVLWTKVDTVEGTSGKGRPGLLAYTKGLARFGLRDYELVCTAEQFKSFAFPFLYRAAVGAIERGTQEEDGATTEAGVGPSGRKLGIRHRRQPSLRDGTVEVIGLTLTAL